MIDLTKIDKPFGELPEEIQIALFKAICIDNRSWECSDDLICWLSSVYCSFRPDRVYRLQPDPKIPDSIDWSHIHPDIKHIRRAATGGLSFFRKQPAGRGFDGWRPAKGDVDYYCSSEVFASYRRGNMPWNEMILDRPEGE